MPPAIDPSLTLPSGPPRTYPGAKRGRKPRNDSIASTPPLTLTPPGVAAASAAAAAAAAAATTATSTLATTPGVGPTTVTGSATAALASLAYRPPTTTPAGGSATPSYAYQTPPLKLAPPHIQVGNASNNATTPASSSSATPTPTIPASAATIAVPPVSTQHHYYTNAGTATTPYAHYYANPSMLPSQYSRSPVPVSVPVTGAHGTTGTSTGAWSASSYAGTLAGTTNPSGSSVPLALPTSTTSSLLNSSYTPSATGYTYTPAASGTPSTTPTSGYTYTPSLPPPPGTASSTTTASAYTYTPTASGTAGAQTYLPRYSLSGASSHPVIALSPAATAAAAAAQSQILRAAGAAAGAAIPIIANPAAPGAAGAAAAAMDEDEEGEEHELPFMSDDVYGQGLLWQSQSKENLKVLMDNFTPQQFERYEAYRRSAFQKQSVRKVIHQATPYTVSQPVAQVVAGFAKVFVGEIIEKAREVQERYNNNSEASFRANGIEPEPLAPEHIREAYRLYQLETGKVGAARVHKGRKMFAR